MAESTQRVSETTKATQLEVEWRKIAAFRSILAHDYLGINLDTVWDITRRDVPELKQAVEEMLSAGQEEASKQKATPNQPAAVRSVSRKRRPHKPSGMGTKKEIL